MSIMHSNVYAENDPTYSCNTIESKLGGTTQERQQGILVDMPMKAPAQYSALIVKVQDKAGKY